MKTTALFIFILSIFISNHVSAQPKPDTVTVNFSTPIQVDSNFAVINAIIRPNGNSANSYFQLNTGSTHEMKSFSGFEDSIPSSFRINGLKPGTTYELKFITFSNDASRESRGSDKITFTTKPSVKNSPLFGKRKK